MERGKWRVAAAESVSTKHREDKKKMEASPSVGPHALNKGSKFSLAKPGRLCAWYQTLSPAPDPERGSTHRKDLRERTGKVTMAQEGKRRQVKRAGFTSA